ncbi:hypothetical protein Avbf_09948 [Armadillidium vulgare]|nr:hypothetical protein Avbf_09948 [Armadillidium vulgare]
MKPNLDVRRCQLTAQKFHFDYKSRKFLCDKGLGLGQILLGKVKLGPHLYLGVAKGDTPPGTLSHWGKALTHTGPVKFNDYLNN